MILQLRMQVSGAVSGIALGAQRASSEVEGEARHHFQATLEASLGVERCEVGAGLSKLKATRFASGRHYHSPLHSCCLLPFGQEMMGSEARHRCPECWPPLNCTFPSHYRFPMQEVTGSEAFRRGKRAGAARAEQAGTAGAKLAAEAGKLNSSSSAPAAPVCLHFLLAQAPALRCPVPTCGLKHLPSALKAHSQHVPCC